MTTYIQKFHFVESILLVIILKLQMSPAGAAQAKMKNEKNVAFIKSLDAAPP